MPDFQNSSQIKTRGQMFKRTKHTGCMGFPQIFIMAKVGARLFKNLTRVVGVNRIKNLTFRNELIMPPSGLRSLEEKRNNHVLKYLDLIPLFIHIKGIWNLVSHLFSGKEETVSWLAFCLVSHRKLSGLFARVCPKQNEER